MASSWPWRNYETYPHIQSPRIGDTINDDAPSYDSRLKFDSERLFTARDDFSVDVIDFRQDGLSAEQPESRAITDRVGFESHFADPLHGYDSRFIIFKPSNTMAVSSCPLHVSEEIARKTFTTYQVMPPFLDCVHAFGNKHHDTDNHFAGAKHRFKYTPSEIDTAKPLSAGLAGFESTYNFKFIHRSENAPAGVISSWRIRQTAVYHQFIYKERKSVWILVQPSERVQTRIKDNLKSQATSCLDVAMRNPLEMHLLFMSAAMKEWRHYFNCLEAHFLEQTSPAVNKAVGVQDSSAKRTIGPRDPSEDLIVSFRSVQKLQKFEETVQNFKASLQTNEDTLNMLKNLNSSLRELFLEGDRESRFSWTCIDSMLSEHFSSCQAQIRNAERLLQRIRGRARLMYNVLDYQHKETLNKQTGEQLRANDRVEVTNKLERKKTMRITKANMREAVGVRIMTVVALVYLPLSFTSSFLEAGIFTENMQRPPAVKRMLPHIDFSSELMKLYLMIAVPLTFVTLAAWGAWEYVAWKKLQGVVDD